jgi:superfamily II DNA or RNA helicase
MLHLSFDNGTLLVKGDKEDVAPVSEWVKYDERVKMYRAQALHYAPILRALHGKFDYEDEVQEYKHLDIEFNTEKSPRQHQADAFSAWKQAKYRGVVVLPTGSGKSFLAQMAIAHIKRNTLIVVPTIDLLNQWSEQLADVFQCKIGMLGGGVKDVRDITVTTYDSALLMMEFIGAQFGLLIYDECHHLPGERNRMSAMMSIAPYRMGLTATPERNDDGEQVLYGLLGPLCYRQDIDQMKGDILAPYVVERLELELDEDEQLAYEENRETYKDFLRENDINFSGGDGWAKFMGLVARQPNGKEAFTAYMTQRRIARSGRAKLRAIWELLQEHSNDRIIIFTADNDTAYEIGRTFFLPVLTHHTKMTERREMLDMFRSGEYPVLVTSKVLNEGVDVPEASVGIVVSGSGSIREHVQRLGRILRKKAGDKQAVLYELISQGTSEYYVSERRREHRAYK